MRFVLIDRILDVQPGQSLVAVKNLSLAEEYLADHFPGFPVMPGVLMLEALTQAGAWLIRETEVEADRLSVYLMERAGYDPDSAVRFWTRFGRRGLNFLGSPTHPNWRRRIALFQSEIDRIRAARAAGQIPMPDFLQPSAATRP